MHKTYPIGMLTMDEIWMAGNTSSNVDTIITYLSLSDDYLTLTPYQYKLRGGGLVVALSSAGNLVSHSSITVAGARPSVSLSHGVTISNGDGTFEKPYIINS